ncbi:transmembrane protein 14C-like [Corticium candelabrum]|uniref:transmembrane protein 14C-like n=1 Tax=Corticium candelabrum TaxID=121492 RepID=UPI002E2569B2|nr:transmembrane protein 14C-like [Corticium candelabrum]
MDAISLVYGVVVAIGGLVGYAKAGSIMSLLFGVVFGGTAAWAAVKLPDKPIIVLSVSTVLTLFMGLRFLRSFKFMPAGLVATLSLLQVVRLGWQYVK